MNMTKTTAKTRSAVKVYLVACTA